MELIGIRRRLAGSMRKSRMAKGWTQAELALRANVSVSTLKRMESGGNQPLFDYLRVLTLINPQLLSRLAEAITFQAEDFAASPLEALLLDDKVVHQKRVRKGKE